MKHEHDLYPMLSVEDALERILGAFHTLEPERVPILETLGRVWPKTSTWHGDDGEGNGVICRTVS